MKKVLSFALAVLMAVAVLPLWLLPTVAYDDTTNTPVQGLEREITEASEYRTLQNTLYKLEKDNELTIAFIGDSIGCGQKPSPTSTLGIDGVNYSSRLTGTTVHQKYANVIYEWFQWYAEDVLEVEADVNAIYSNWGGRTLRNMASYINETVLVHSPDLVIIEAWNVATEADGTKSGAYFLESMIQQIYATNPYADIMILDMGGDIVGNPACKAVWEHYNIPIVRGMGMLAQLTMLNKDMWGQGATNVSYGFTNEAGVWIPATGSYFYNGGNPHVNEEAYSFVNKLFTESAVKLIEEAKEGDLYGQYTIVQPDTKRIVFNDDGTVKSYPTDTYYTSEGLFGGLFYRSDIIFADEFTYDPEIWTLNGTKPDITKLYDAYSVVQGQYLSPSTTGASFTFDFYGSAFMVYGKDSGSYTVSIDGTALETTYAGETVTIPASDEDAQHTVTITMTGTGSIYCVSTFAHTYTAPQKVERENEYYVNFFGKILDQYVHDNTYNGYAIIPNPLQWIAFGRSRVYEGSSVQIPTSSIIHKEAYDDSYGNFVGWVEADDVTFVNGNKIPTVNEYKYENGEIIDVATGEPKKVYCAGQYIDATRDMDLVAVYSNSDEYSAKTVNYASSVDSSAGFLPQLSSDRAQENYVNGVDITATSDKAEFTFEELYQQKSHTYGFSGASKNNTYWYYDAETDTVSSMVDKWWGASPYYINTRNSQSVSRVQKDGVSCVRIERTLGDGYYDFVPYIVLPGANVTIGESVFVTVKYYYDTTNSKGNLVGKQMMLTLNCELGSNKYSFSTASNETIVGDQWATLTFDFTGKYTYYGKEVFDTVKEVAISASALTYAGVWKNVQTHQGADHSKVGDVVYIGDFIYNFETPTVDVTYKNNGEVVKTENVQGEPVVLPSAIEGMVNEGYQLIGWTDGTNTYDVGASKTFYEDVTLEAVWAKIYTVTVSDGAGNSNAYTTIDKITLPDADEFTKENSGIIGWTDGEATYAPGQTITVTGDMNLEAVWETSYTVKFYNGTTLLSESVVAGSITLPAAPESEGEAVFLGWSDGESTFSAGATVDIVGDTTFVAQWMEKSDKITVNYADYYSNSSDIYDAWIAFARDADKNNITKSKFTEWGITTTASAPWYQKYDEDTDTQYIGKDRWWGTYIAWYNFLIYNDEATIDGERGVSVKRYQLTYDNSTTSGAYVLDNGLGKEAEKEFSGYYMHMPMPVPSGITYEYAKVVTVKYYYDPANDAATNLVGKQARLDVKVPDGYVYEILSEETIVANQWSTLTFTLVGALFDNYGIADYNLYKDTDISAMSLIVDTTLNRMKTNDVFYVSEASFDKNFDIKMDHSVSFKNNLTLNYYVPDSEFDSCYNSNKKADTLVADSLVLTVEKDVYDRNGNKTVETTTITEYTEETIDGELYYRFVYGGIAATEVGNEIRASVTFDTVSAKNTRTTYTSGTEAYSVKTYAYNRLEKSTSDAFKTLLVDTLNYCAAAQTYFGIRTDALVNAELTEEQRALGTQTDVEVQNTASVETNDSATVSVYGVSVVFNSNVEMKFYMDMGEQDLTNVVLKLTYTVDGVETVKEIPASEFINNNGLYTAKLTDLAAAELFEDVKIVILDGETAISDTVTYNVETYINNRMAASSDNNFKALLGELAKYVVSAKNYFAEE